MSRLVMCLRRLAVALSSAAAFSAASGTNEYDQAQFEDLLVASVPYCDYDALAHIPRRHRDRLQQYRWYMDRSGWSTNQILQALMLAMTNYLSEADWADARKRACAGVAAWHLGEIDLPAATNFLSRFNAQDDTPRMKLSTIPAMVRHTNLEPCVLEYMRTLCVRTNIYDQAATCVMDEMFETLKTMPDAMKPAATNRVARYMYFAIHHVTDSQGWQDRELANFIPAYSNSVQRLDLMRYVSTSATNAMQRANASNVVERLSAIPFNELNNVEWIAE